MIRNRDTEFFGIMLVMFVLLVGVVALFVNIGREDHAAAKAAQLCRLGKGQPVVNYYGEVACVTPHIDKGE